MSFNNDDYSRAYEEFVGNGQDVIGLVAYSLYKSEKRRRVVEIKTAQSRKPNRKELKEIEEFCLARRDHYIREANTELDKLVHAVITSTKEEIFKVYFKDDYDNNQLLKNIYTNTQPAKKRTLWAELGISVLGNFAWAIVLVLLTVIVYFLNDDLQSYKQTIINKLQGNTQTVQRDSILKK